MLEYQRTGDGDPVVAIHGFLSSWEVWDRIAPQLDAATRRVQVRATVDNADGSLRPEMFARAYPVAGGGMAGGGRTSVRVPADALLALGKETVVYVRKDERGFERRVVQVALEQGDDAWVTAGVAPGEPVVVAGALLLESERLAARK